MRPTRSQLEYPLVLVKWWDACGSPGWAPPSDAHYGLCVCFTSGYLIEETVDAVAVAQSKNASCNDNQVDCITVIPKVNVIETWDLLPKERKAKKK